MLNVKIHGFMNYELLCIPKYFRAWMKSDDAKNKLSAARHQIYKRRAEKENNQGIAMAQ